MIHVVTGHICSGKSTFVREHATGEDVVIDFDRMALAIRPEGASSHDNPEPIRKIISVVRWFAIDEAVRLHRFGCVPNVWIIHAYPTENDIGRYRRLGAGVKTCDAAPDVLMERAKACRPKAIQAELLKRLELGGWGQQAACHSSQDPTTLPR